MARAYIGLGANIGEPSVQVSEAMARLDAVPGVELVARSRPIITKPWGKTDQPDFTNAVVEVETALGPFAVLDACRAIECGMGRSRGEKWGPRSIDIDIIAYDRLIFASERLTVPHPYAHARGFVLDPLREIAPDIADWIVAVANRG